MFASNKHTLSEEIVLVLCAWMYYYLIHPHLTKKQVDEGAYTTELIKEGMKPEIKLRRKKVK